jgi:Fe-S-cluster containining protein
VTDAPAQRARARAEPFGYACGGCRNCCRQHLVAVNPYETARLARRLGLTDEAFQARFTRRGQGRELAHTAAGDCVFLGPDGCTVYADRPLTCRLYPLWRSLDADGNEVWRHATPHPNTRGDYTVTGTIADFLDAQDAHAHIAANDAHEADRRPQIQRRTRPT